MTERSQRPPWLGEDRRGWDHVRLHVQLLRDDRLGAVEIAVYAGIAVHAELATGEAHPAKSTLARYAGISERGVFKALQNLCSAGYVRVEQRPGRASVYVLLPPPELLLPRHDVPPTPAPPAGVPRHHVPDTLAPRATEQEPRHQEPDDESQGTNTPAAAQQGSLLPAAPAAVITERRGAWDLYFDAFWDAYPRKVGKLDARKAWQQAKRLGVDPAAVIAGARAYAADPNRDDTYTAHPATWLRAGRWDDDPLPARGGAPQAQVSGALDTLAQLGGFGQRAIGGGR